MAVGAAVAESGGYDDFLFSEGPFRVEPERRDQKPFVFIYFRNPLSHIFLLESTVGCKAAGRGEGSLWREVGRRVRERAGAGGAGAEDNKFHVPMRRNLNSEFQVGPETAK